MLKGVNDLESQFPQIASEWLCNKNNLSPSKVYAYTDTKYWFKCSSCGYERLQSVRDRTKQGKGCAACSNQIFVAGNNDLASKRPDLTAEWSSRNTLKPNEVLWRADKDFWWTCSKCGYERLQNLYQRTTGSGCAACAGQIVVKGINDLATKRPDVSLEWSPRNTLGADEVLWRSHKAFWLICSTCGYERLQELYTRVNAKNSYKGCSVCSGRKVVAGINDLASKRPEIAKEWSPRNKLRADEVLWRKQEKYYLICQDCGFERLQVLKNRVDGSGCSLCANRVAVAGVNDLASQRPDIAENWSSRNILSTEEVMWRTQEKFWFACKVCGHEYLQSPYDKVTLGYGCPACLGQVVVKGFNDLVTLFPKVAAEWDFQRNREEDGTARRPEDFSKASNYKADWICSQGHRWKAYISDRTGLNHGCLRCYKERTRSLTEIALFDQVLAWFPEGEVESTWRDLGFEIDIWIPSKKIGIEFNGIYWHSEEFVGTNKHFEKYKKCKEAGITLLQVWEDDWVHRKNQVLLGLQRKLGVAKEERLNARDMELFGLEDHEARDFLNQWHIQGFVGGKLKLGLLDKEGKIRTAAVFKNKGNGVLSLERYATNAIVRGGLGKTLAYVKRVFPEFSIETFADHTWSDGGLYETLGFTKAYEIEPDYRYVVGDKREHKFGYRLNRFKTDPNLKWEEGLTERELASLNGLQRIWDAGKTKYILEGVK